MSEVTRDSPTNHSAAFASHQHGAAVSTGTDGQFEIAGYQRPAHRSLGGIGLQALIWKRPTPKVVLECEQGLGRSTPRVARRDQPPISVITTEDPGCQRLLPIGPTTTVAAGAPLHTRIENFSWK